MFIGVVVESIDAPLFASPARRISVDYGQEGELTPKADTPTQFKYQFRDFNEKYKQEEKKIYKVCKQKYKQICLLYVCVYLGATNWN